MIASWMLYAVLVGVLVAVAAEACDRIAAARGWARRAPWAVAMAAAVAWPALAALARDGRASATAAVLSPYVVTVQPLDAIADSGFRAALAAVLDPALLGLWALLSALVMARLVRGMISLRARRRGWTSRELDGHRVRMSTDVGPAVVGLRPMDVVVPQWITMLDASLRALVLRHEEEHREARDPYLLFFGAVGVAVMPWNPAVWYLARRLRLAIEIDCDARVLRVHPSAERYGLLMLTIAQRRTVAPTLFAPMLSEPASTLERRILAMRTVSRRFVRLTIVGGSLVAAGALALACSLVSDAPTGPSPSRSVRPGPTHVSNDQVFFEYQVEKQVQPVPDNAPPRYPDLLRTSRIEGAVLTQFVVRKDGTPDMATFKVLKSTHELFTAAVLNALPAMRFYPAQVGGMPVKQLVQMPFQFALSRGAALSHAVPDGNARPASAPPLGALAPTAVDTKPASNAPGYVSFRIDRSAQPMPGNPPAHYPDLLRSAGGEGEVLVQFVVDESGNVEMSTVKVLRSSHALFTRAVLDALSKDRFSPATSGGRAVKQLVTMPFDFSLSR